MMSKSIALCLAGAIAAGSLATPSFARPYGERYDHASRDYNDYCREQKKKGQKQGAILGAIAGAVLGSQVSGRGAKTEGAVVGALAGAAVGSNIGRSAAKTRCDRDGAYWSYRDTYPYRGDYYDHHRYDNQGAHDDGWYEQRRCRWVEAYQGEWVRTCPDRQGRYRVTR